MYLVTHFRSLWILCVMVTSLMVVPGANASFLCAEEELAGVFKKIDCGGSGKAFCAISTKTGKASGCQPTVAYCPSSIPEDGNLRCLAGKKYCCCGKPGLVCNDVSDPAIKEKVCNVPEMKAATLCCPQGGCKAGISAATGTGGGGGGGGACAVAPTLAWTSLIAGVGLLGSVLKGGSLR